jgi:dolichol kinase
MQNAIINFEIKRKLFHLSSLIFPLIYLFTPRITMSIALLIITAITIYLDISRHYNPKIKELIDKFLGKFLRTSEKSGEFSFSGASYMAAGFFFTCLFFAKGLAITSWLVLIISDALAAIVGIKFGVPLSNGKSIAGSITFFLSTLLISIIGYFFIGYNTSFLVIIISSVVTTILEFYSKQIKIDDNLSVPVTYGLVTAICAIFFSL